MKHVYHIFPIRVSKRDELERYLIQNGIHTNKHYPIPIHRQLAYVNEQTMKDAVLPIAEDISATELSIPIYYGMTDKEIRFIVEKLNEF